jgi:hypothetical protein
MRFGNNAAEAQITSNGQQAQLNPALDREASTFATYAYISLFIAYQPVGKARIAEKHPSGAKQAAGKGLFPSK